MATYNNLIIQLQQWFQRSSADVVTINNIPTFIALAEDKICSDYENAGFVKTVVSIQPLGGFQNGVCVYPKPSRWRRNITFNYGAGPTNNNREPLFLRDYSYLVDYWPDRTQVALPIYYGEYDYNHWLIAPTPDAYYPYEVRYIEMPQPLSIQNQSNWLTEYAYGLLFYASFLEALPYLKNYDKIDSIRTLYQERLGSLKAQDEKRITDASNTPGMS